MRNRKYIFFVLGALLLLSFSLVVFVFSGKAQESDQRENPLVTNEHDLPAILKRGKLTILAENSSTSFFIYKGKKWASNMRS